jgi:hypothetical protein
MKKNSWIYPIAGFVALVVIFLIFRGRPTEPFFGMSPGTLTQLQSTHVPAPGLMPDVILVPQQHRFKPWDMPRNNFGAENAALKLTPAPYLIY